MKDSSGETLQTVAMRAEVVAGQTKNTVSGDMTSALTAGLVIIVALFVAIGLVIAFRKTKNNDDSEKVKLTTKFGKFFPFYYFFLNF